MTGDTLIRSEIIDEEQDENSSDEDDYEGRYETDKIMLPSPKVSTEEHDLPILVTAAASFEERIMAANPEAATPVELSPCDTCGRKFNMAALERHTKVCQKNKKIPRRIFDAVNKLWKSEAEVEQEKQEKARPAKAGPRKKPAKKEDEYKACEYCGRKFCDNAFDRHVEFCREKYNRLKTSPPKDDQALAKLQARVKYNPKEVAKKARRTSSSPSRKMSNSSLYSEVSLPPWSLPNSISGRNTPNYRSLTQVEGNLRSRRSGSTLQGGTQSLGRAGGAALLARDKDWDPETDAKATTLSRNASGRGSIRKPALTKAALMRLAAGEKKAEDEERKRQKSEFGSGSGHNELLRTRSVTPGCSNIMSRSMGPGTEFRDYGGGGGGGTRTPQLARRSTSRCGQGRDSISPYSWQRFKPVIQPSVCDPLTSDRAEPDGVENDEQYRAARNGLEGAYDHSKEYDPFETAERQMQELLFGTGAPSSSSSSCSRSLQKPQPVRPSSTSAFSAYVPSRGPLTTTHGSVSPNKQYSDSSSKSYSFTKPGHSTFSSSSPSKTTRDYLSPNRQSPPKFSSSSFTRPSALNLMTSSDYVPSSKLSDDDRSSLLTRGGSLRAASTASRNWKDIFPSLSRQSSSVQPTARQPDTNNQSALARFCHECGNPFPMAHVRFCCECGVKRLYC